MNNALQELKSSQATEECDICTQIAEAGKLSQPPKLSKRGVVLLSISGAFVAGVTAVMMPFVNPGLRRFALPYIPASTEQVRNVFHVLKGRTGNLIDIGSGDGRVTLAAAERGFQASGVELNRWLVLYSRWSARRKGLQSQTRFFRKDLWKTDFSSYNNIVIFGVESMMPRLQQKLSEEVHQDAAVVACRFPLPTWKPSQTVGEGVDTVWLYHSPFSGVTTTTKETVATCSQHTNQSSDTVATHNQILHSSFKSIDTESMSEKDTLKTYEKHTKDSQGRKS